MIGNTPYEIAIPQVVGGGAADLKHIRAFLGDFGILELLSSLSYASGLTSRVRLGVSVMLTTERKNGSGTGGVVATM